jgi:hypothetical protein
VKEHMHMMADKTLISIRDMDDKWLNNTIKLKERRAAEGIRAFDRRAGTTLGDVIKVHTIYGKKALKWLNHHEYVAERNRREKIRNAQPVSPQ